VFVFALDLKILAPKVGNFMELYRDILSHVLQACARQRPTLRAHMVTIKRQMHSVTEKRPPLAGMHPHRALERIARELNTAWRDPNGLPRFLRAVFNLPITLPRAFGFKSIALFVDNLEDGGVPIGPRDPFDAEQPLCFGVEHFKFALNQANVIINSESVPAPLDEHGLDLRAGLDAMTLDEANQDLGSRTRRNVRVSSKEPQRAMPNDAFSPTNASLTHSDEPIFYL
jgi:hypothetical protein